MQTAKQHLRGKAVRKALFLTLTAVILVAWVLGLAGREAVYAEHRQHLMAHKAERIAVVLSTVLAQRRQALAATADRVVASTDLRRRLEAVAPRPLPDIDFATHDPAAPLTTAIVGSPVQGEALRAGLLDLWAGLAGRFDLTAMELRVGPRLIPILQVAAQPPPAAKTIPRAGPSPPHAGQTAPRPGIATLEGVGLILTDDGRVLGSVILFEDLAPIVRAVEASTGARAALFAADTVEDAAAEPLYRHAAYAAGLPRPAPTQPIWHVRPSGQAYALSAHALPAAATGSEPPILIAQTDVTAAEAAFSRELTVDRIILTAMAAAMLMLLGGLWLVNRRHDVSRRDRDRLAFALDASGEGLWEWDVRRDRVTLSARWQSFFGTPADAVPVSDGQAGDVTVALKSLRQAVHPDDLPGMLRAMDEHWRGLTDLYRFTFRVRAGDGWAWVLDRGRIAERNRRGEVVRMIGTQADITDLKRAQARLEMAERLHREMFERSTAPMLLTERDTGAIRDANEAAYLFYGWTRSTLKRMSMADLEALPAEEITHRKRQALIEGRPSYTADHHRAAGDRRQVAVHSSPLTVDGTPYLFTIVHDITDAERYLRSLHQRERELEEAHGEIAQALERTLAANADLERMRLSAEQANHAKSEFLAAMSHDLRTPLNAILGFSDLLLAHLPNQSQERVDDYLSNIHEAGSHLIALIDDLLDLSKIDAGRMEVSDDVANPNDILDNMVRVMRPRIDDHDLTLNRGETDETLLLVADIRMVRQMLLNLIGNAIKFTPAGGTIAVAVRRGPDGAILFTVGDTGPGMSPTQLAEALEPFRGNDAMVARDNEQKSTGLGLSLVTRMMALHGGRLDIETAPGEGLSATLRFPPQRTRRRPAAAKPPVAETV